VGRPLVALLRERGVRVLATARSLRAEARLRELGAEPLHTDLASIGGWEREAREADVVFHLAHPRVVPPLRRIPALRRARAAAAGAEALDAVADGRPVVVLSTALVYGAQAGPAVDAAPLGRTPALAAASLAAETALTGPAQRVVRVPWVYGRGSLIGDVAEGLRMRRHRIVGDGENAWSLISARDAAAALVAALDAPAGAYTAAEPDVPTQNAVVDHLCRELGLRRPDHVPARLAGLSMGGAVSEALALSLRVRTGRLGELGWSPRDDWREGLVRPEEPPAPTG
jgi:nucleoside-diphosphate-sugar epimerase